MMCHSSKYAQQVFVVLWEGPARPPVPQDLCLLLPSSSSSSSSLRLTQPASCPLSPAIMCTTCTEGFYSFEGLSSKTAYPLDPVLIIVTTTTTTTIIIIIVILSSLWLTWPTLCLQPWRVPRAQRASTVRRDHPARRPAHQGPTRQQEWGLAQCVQQESHAHPLRKRTVQRAPTLWALRPAALPVLLVGIAWHVGNKMFSFLLQAWKKTNPSQVCMGSGVKLYFNAAQLLQLAWTMDKSFSL